MSTITSFTLPTSLRALAPGADKRYHVYPLVSGKNKKKKRWIEAPDSELKAAQRWLLDNWLYHLGAPRVRAGVLSPGRPILTNAAEHVGRRWVVTAKFRDFFPVHHRGRIATCRGTNSNLDEADRSTVVQLVTRRGRLPQGAPTSPHLANLVARTLDFRLSGLPRAARLDLHPLRRRSDLLGRLTHPAPTPGNAATRVAMGHRANRQ
ncbi:MAG: hypothetical protein CM1200mP2_31920 [Planctomycetaceae bacterium]|nr:MAG: hypothetical protein CM1200mP2_31920 [Planctomycetaceae bacterium]